jgi:hypothetical protein
MTAMKECMPDGQELNDPCPYWIATANMLERQFLTKRAISNFIKKTVAVDVIQIEMWIPVSPCPLHAQPVYVVCKSIFN